MELTNQASEPQGKLQAPAQCMAFRLGGQAYAVDILSVQEIRRFSAPTSLPDVPSYLSGVINLRGAVVPVLDLRARFNLEASVDRLTVIIVVAVNGKSIGLVVDEVTSVIKVAADAVRAAPTLARHVDGSFIVGLIPDGDILVTLIDVTRLVSSEVGSA
jgi:purine-binding chemotaxis protein CheW